MILNGVYTVDENPEVHVIELTFDHPPDKIDVGQITQEIQGRGKGNWQSPWDEKYLDENGEKVIGDYFDIPQGQAKTRLVFYFHFVDFDKPLLTQLGQVSLARPTTLPSRLRDLIRYEKPD